MSDDTKPDPDINLAADTAPNNGVDIHVIHNSKYVFTRICIIVLLVAIAFTPLPSFPLCYVSPRTFNLETNLFISFITLGPIIVFYVFSVRAQWDGVVVDVPNNKLTYPGGAKSANEFSEYFSKDFLLQKFKRFEVNISDIKNIKSESVEKLCIGGKYHSAVSIVGSFGSASIIFSEEGKRDQLFAILREVNSMGSPVLKVN